MSCMNICDTGHAAEKLYVSLYRKKVEISAYKEMSRNMHNIMSGFVKEMVQYKEG